MADSQRPTPPVPPQKKPLREVWFSCRAKPGCTGKKAVIVFTKGIPGQGSNTRYRCLTCNGSWHVQL